MHDRLVALLTELGKRFNGHANFEGIGLPELRLGQPIELLSATTPKEFYDNLLDVQRQIVPRFHNTLTTSL